MRTRIDPPTAEWFSAARFGLFVHWGIYSTAGRHEWVKSREQLGDTDYQRHFDHFDPDLFDPEAWADTAWNAGMRYLVVTTKHHDGFCLWDSRLTDYKATNTPYGRDLLAPMVQAFRDKGFRIGFYHSLLDWHHPDFPVDFLHPQRDEADVLNAAGGGRDIQRYADYLHGQVRELLTEFGRIDVMWFDFSYPNRGFGAKGHAEWRSTELIRMVRELQPGILVNNRLDLGVGAGPDTGDITTPEQVQVTGQVLDDEGNPALWEACQTLNGSWGYDRDNLDWKSPELLVRMLIDTVAKDGNMLLNVGPNGRGEFEPRALDRLTAIADWMRLHEPAIRGAGATSYEPPTDCRYTYRAGRLYLHLFAWPMRHIHLPGLVDKVAYARLLHDGSEVRLVRQESSADGHHTAAPGIENALTLELPVQRPDVTVPVVELFLR